MWTIAADNSQQNNQVVFLKQEIAQSGSSVFNASMIEGSTVKAEEMTKLLGQEETQGKLSTGINWRIFSEKEATHRK